MICEVKMSTRLHLVAADGCKVWNSEFVAVTLMGCLEDRQLYYICLSTVFCKNCKLIDSSGT